jgi:hypothetical protein
MAVQQPEGNVSRRALVPLFAAYSVFGVYWGVWVVVFGDFLRANDLTEGTAGFQLGLLAVVSILTMTLLSPRLQRYPLSVTVPLGLFAMGFGAMIVGHASGGWLALGFAVLGIGNGLIDVFVNVGGQMIEASSRRPVLQFLHASYNVGGIVGALGAGIATLSGVDFRVRLSVTAAVLAVIAVWTATSSQLRAQPGPSATETKISLSIFLRSRALIVPAIVVLSAFFVEGSMDIWSVIYLRRTLEASALAGAIAFATFSLAMAFGRITAGRVLFGLGYRATLRVSGVGSLVAGLTAAITRSTVVAGIAFVFLGFFIASAAPAAFGMIAETDEDPALAVAAMTTVGYSGFVVGPPLMGLLAERAGLRATMMVLVAMSLGVVAGGVFGRPETPELDLPDRGEA